MPNEGKGLSVRLAALVRDAKDDESGCKLVANGQTNKGVS